MSTYINPTVNFLQYISADLKTKEKNRLAFILLYFIIDFFLFSTEDLQHETYEIIDQHLVLVIDHTKVSFGYTRLKNFFSYSLMVELYVKQD